MSPGAPVSPSKASFLDPARTHSILRRFNASCAPQPEALRQGAVPTSSMVFRTDRAQRAPSPGASAVNKVSISKIVCLVRSLSISATIFASVSLVNSRRRSPSVFGGATMTSCLTEPARTARLIRSAIEAAKRSFSSSCQSVSSTALRMFPTLLNARPGTSVPCSCRRRVRMLLDRQAPQIGELLVSLVDQKQGLLAVAYEHPCAMREFAVRHPNLPAFRLFDCPWTLQYALPLAKSWIRILAEASRARARPHPRPPGAKIVREAVRACAGLLTTSLRCVDHSTRLRRAELLARRSPPLLRDGKERGLGGPNYLAGPVGSISRAQFRSGS